jgi:hypothetical protein
MSEKGHGNLRLCTEWLNFHRRNLDLWQLYEKFCLTEIQGGRPLFGTRAIGENMRWRLAMRKSGRGFDVNNSYLAFYARLFVTAYPNRREFFEFRIAAGDRLNWAAVLAEDWAEALTIPPSPQLDLFPE